MAAGKCFDQAMVERTLVLMRHAKSDRSTPVPDRERPLNARGLRQATEAGDWLASHLPDLGLVITSPAERSRATWRAAGTAYSPGPHVDVDERAYTFDDPGLVPLLHDIDDSVTTALLVAHNPAIEELVDRLTGTYVGLVTSALAVLRFTGSWKDLGPPACMLVAVGRPPEPVT